MKEQDIDILYNFVQATIDYSTRYNKQFRKFYNEKYNGEEVIEKAKLHALYTYILQNESTFRSKRIKLLALHEELVVANIGIPSAYQYFVSILKRMAQPEIGIESVLIHKSKGKKRKTKFSTELVEKAEILYARNPLWKYPKILVEVNEYARLLGLPAVGIDHLKRHFCKREVQQRLRSVRNGEDYFLSNIGHQNHLQVPYNSGKQLEIDGTRLQIPYYDRDNNEICFLVIFCILDVTSRMVLGYSLGESENSSLVVEAFRRFFSQHDFAPVQITRDNGSAYKSEFKFLETYLSLKGVEWVATSNPRSSSHISSFQRIFSTSICSSIEAYIGLGIRTKDIDSRKNAKQLRKTISQNKAKLPARSDLIFTIDRLIVEYNNASFAGKKSAFEIFKERFDLEEVIELSEEDKAIITGVRKIRSVKNSEIEIRYKYKSHFYKLDYDLASKYEKVLTVHFPSDMGKIHVFDSEFRFLSKIELDESIPSLESERNESEQQRLIATIVKRRKQFNTYVQDVKSKEERSKRLLDNVIPLYDYNADKSKEEQISIQNNYTKRYFEMNDELNQDDLDFPENDSYFSADIERIKNKV